MNFKKIMRKEKFLWHRHFIPSLIAGVLVGIISFLYQATVSNILLFSSVGASALILTNSQSHHLTKLRTTIVAYVLASFVALGIYYLNKFIVISLSLNIILIVFLTGIIMFLANSFHPPAVSAALAFIVLEKNISDLLFLLLSVVILLIFVRFLTYTLSQHLTVKEFKREFKKEFK